MRIEAIFLKVSHGHPMQKIDRLTALTGVGIHGDVSNSRASSRQILVLHQSDLLRLNAQPSDLRENLLLSGGDRNLVRPGNTLIFASGLRIALLFNCEPCKTIQSAVPRLSDAIGRRGVLGVVLAGGDASVGAEVMISEQTHHPWSDEPLERTLNIISQIPVGRVFSYRHLLVAAGLIGPYYRVMPKYLAHAMARNLPAHRVLDSKLQLPEVTRSSWHLLKTELPITAIYDDMFSSAQDPFTVSDAVQWDPACVDLLYPAAKISPLNRIAGKDYGSNT